MRALRWHASVAMLHKHSRILHKDALLRRLDVMLTWDYAVVASPDLRPAHGAPEASRPLSPFEDSRSVSGA